MRERIKEIIDREGMGQSQFADYIGVNRPTLSHILAGRNNTSLEVVMKIHQAFPKISMQWLLDGKGAYEGDIIPGYSNDTIMDDRTADVASTATSVPSAGAHDEGLPYELPAQDERLSSRFHQGELFGENAVFVTESTGASKKRKEMPLQTPQKAPHITEYQSEKVQKNMHRKIIEIKIFYDDGTYETFKH